MVSKLDAILKLVFDHFNKLHSSIPTVLVPSSSPPHFSTASDRDSQSPECEPHALLATQFHTLLAIFDRSILRTFKSRYTQFLLFWYASLDPEFSDLFLGLLVDKALFASATANGVERVAASSYIGSFVSRAEFIDREGARRAVQVLCAFLGAHLDAVEAGNAASDDHSVFYAIVQSVLLIFCFRWRDLQAELEVQEVVQKTWISELGVVQRVITSDLNPLKVCQLSYTWFLRLNASCYNTGLFTECRTSICAHRASHRLHVLLLHFGGKQACTVSCLCWCHIWEHRFRGVAYIFPFRSLQATALRRIYTGRISRVVNSGYW